MVNVKQCDKCTKLVDITTIILDKYNIMVGGDYCDEHYEEGYKEVFATLLSELKDKQEKEEYKRIHGHYPPVPL